MSVNPISLNVIRQAIEWSNLPKPTSIRRQYSAFRHGPSRAIVHVYKAFFPLTAILLACDNIPGVYGDDLFRFRYALQNSFCEDVEVQTAWLERGTQRAIAILRIAEPVVE